MIDRAKPPTQTERVVRYWKNPDNSVSFQCLKTGVVETIPEARMVYKKPKADWVTPLFFVSIGVVGLVLWTLAFYGFCCAVDAWF